MFGYVSPCFILMKRIHIGVGSALLVLSMEGNAKA